MEPTPINFPVGVRDQNRFAKDAPLTVAPEGLKNIRIIDVGGRQRPTTRYRHAKAFVDSLPGGVADLYPMGRASAIQNRRGPLRPLAGGAAVGVTGGVPRSQDTVTGCCRIIDADGNSYFGFEDPTYSTLDCQRVAADNCLNVTAVRGERFKGAFACNYTKAYGGSIGNQVVVRVSYLTETSANAGGDGPITRQWTAEVEDMAPAGSVTAAATDMPVASLAVCGPWVFVAVQNYVYCFASDTSLGYTAGQYVQRYQIATFSKITKIEAVCNIVRDSLNNAVQYDQNSAELMILGDGWTTVVGEVTTNTNSEGLYYRAGIERATINLSEAGEDALTVATRPFAAQPTPIVESHNAFRLSDWITSERGRATFDMAVWNYAGQDLEVEERFADLRKTFVATTNDGFGPTNAADDKPNGNGGWANLFCLDNGNEWDDTDREYNIPDPIKWSVDTDSRRVDWQSTGYFNDIPYDATGAIDPNNGLGPEPTITSLAVNPVTGAVYAAGQNSGGYNIFGYNMFDGSQQWRNSVGGFVKQHCAAFFAPTSSVLQGQTSVVVAATRNNVWPDSDSEYATIFFINPTTGAIRATRDLGSGVVAWSVAASNRYVMVGSDHF